MYTLKIRWCRWARNEQTDAAELADETTLFVPAELVRVHAAIIAGERESAMKHWHTADGPGYLNYLSVGANGENGGRLICVVRDGTETWYLASQAWVLGPTGSTIERIAP